MEMGPTVPSSRKVHAVVETRGSPFTCIDRHTSHSYLYGYMQNVSCICIDTDIRFLICVIGIFVNKCPLFISFLWGKTENTCIKLKIKFYNKVYSEWICST